MISKHINIIPDHLNLADFEDDEMQAAVHKALAEALATTNNTDFEVAVTDNQPLNNTKGSKK